MKKRNMGNILFIVPLPPPVHGSSLMCRQIQQSEMINSTFDCTYVNLSTSRSNAEVNKFTPCLLIKKSIRFFKIYLNVFWHLLTHHPDIAYLSITCHGIGFLKDASFVLLCKSFNCKIVLHQHNKGMKDYVHKPIYRWLLPFVYKNSTVILLSWLLYDDISLVVSRSQIRICPNGI